MRPFSFEHLGSIARSFKRVTRLYREGTEFRRRVQLNKHCPTIRSISVPSTESPPLFLAALALAAAPVCQAVWHDTARNRDIPVRITLPAGSATVPVVLWSPGLGGDVGSGSIWVSAWSAAGLAVVQMQHHGSDDAVYRPGGTLEERRARIVAATSPDQLLARVGDAGFVLGELGARKSEAGCDLTRIDTHRAAIAGHSMGAWVAQAVAGQRFDGGPVLADDRFRAAVALSPTGAPGTTTFAGVAIPFLSITGSSDGAPPIADPALQAAALAARSAPYRSMPADGRKCLLVIGDASHMMFAGNRLTTANTTAQHVQDIGARASVTFLKSALGAKRLDLAAIRKALAPGDSLDCK